MTFGDKWFGNGYEERGGVHFALEVQRYKMDGSVSSEWEKIGDYTDKEDAEKQAESIREEHAEHMKQHGWADIANVRLRQYKRTSGY